jgi:hypothetical protein
MMRVGRERSACSVCVKANELLQTLSMWLNRELGSNGVIEEILGA